MVPPFKLEALKEPYRIPDKNKRLIHIKNTYRPEVKVEDWYDYYTSLPYDNCPHAENNIDLYKSHYDTLGHDKYHCYATTTSDMLRQNELKNDYIDPTPVRKVLSYFSYDVAQRCSKKETKLIPEMCSDYISETHKKFSTPYPYVMKGMALPKAPFMSTRVIKLDTNNKFLDDGLMDNIRQLQCHKGFRHKSYNFCTGKYTDGSIPPVQPKHTYIPEYERCTDD